MGVVGVRLSPLWLHRYSRLIPLLTLPSGFTAPPTSDNVHCFHLRMSVGWRREVSIWWESTDKTQKYLAKWATITLAFFTHDYISRVVVVVVVVVKTQCIWENCTYHTLFKKLYLGIATKNKVAFKITYFAKFNESCLLYVHSSVIKLVAGRISPGT